MSFQTNKLYLSSASTGNDDDEKLYDEQIKEISTGLLTDQKSRVLSFDDIKDDSIKQKTQERIMDFQRKINDSDPVSIKSWCETHSLPAGVVVKLLNKADLPIFRLGDYVGAYPDHLTLAVRGEFSRQTDVQLKNRQTARILGSRNKKKKNAD